MKYIAKLSIFIWLCICMSGCSGNTQPYLVVQETESQEKPSAETQSAGETPDVQAGQVFVYVCGQVNASGVYGLPEGSRVCDAVEAAGGMTDTASRDYWNLAEVLTDGQMIYFPTEEEAAMRQQSAGAEPSSSGNDSDGRVNINTATLEQLMTLPGVGQTRGEAIIAYREAHGGFAGAEDIMKVSGIKNALYAKIKDYITVD